MYLFTKKLDFHSPTPIPHQALQMAVYDEFRAQASYQRIVETFGAVMPFVNIVQAEIQHINALLPLLYRYGVPVPYNDWYHMVTPAPTLQENCELGVAAEIQNARMYDDLLHYVVEPDIREVFINLRNASFYHHLPAFRRCVNHG
jgi:hypothetical protein